MAKTKNSSGWSLGNFDLRESYPSLILGAIIVVILGLLVANFFSRNQEDIGDGEQTEQAQESAAPAAGSEYTVKENDSLAKISEQVYGTQELWPEIARENNISNPDRLLVGTVINIPALEVEVAVEEPETEEAIGEVEMQAAPGTYNVKEGDTLFKIAEEVYGDGSRWVEIFRANNLGRLPNGNPLVFWGTTIRIP